LVCALAPTAGYAVGEFVALDAQAAIDRAIEVFGAAAGYQAEEIPKSLDAAKSATRCTTGPR
jgi:hypothetical protein